MQIIAADLRNFRCFKRFETALYPLTFIAGPNGSGKTSLLEALAIGAQLRSFRTAHIREAIAQEAEAFSLRLTIQNEQQDHVRVGYGTTAERLVHINGEEASRTDLGRVVQVVTMTEDAMELIQGFPEVRRSFFDQIGCSGNPDYRKLLLTYQRLSRQRAAVLYRPESWHLEVYRIVTAQMWELSAEIRALRKKVMRNVEQVIAHLTGLIIPGTTISFLYTQPEQEAACPSAEIWSDTQAARERQARRSLMGAHLDDVDIIVDGMQARRYASRGMQKLLVVLMKITQSQIIGSTVILLDDIMSDFDERRARAVVELLISRNAQLIFTIPMHEESPYTTLLRAYGAKGIELKL